MNRFVYQAYTETGKVVSGVLEARSHGEALQSLRGRGLIPFASSPEAVSIKRTGWSTSREVIPRSRRAAARLAFAYEFGVLLRAQLPVDQALSLLPQQPELRKAADVIKSIAEGVRGGKSLGEALSVHPRFLLQHEIAMIKAAEQTGSVADIMLQLASSMRRHMELRSRLKAALTYPAILLCMSLLTIALVAAVLVPNLLPLFEGEQASPPFIIRLFVVLGSNMTSIAVLLLAAGLGAAVLARVLARNEAFLLTRDKLLLQLPIVGQLALQAETIRTTNTLGLLLRSGIALSQALVIVQSASKSKTTRLALARATEKVTAGMRMARAFAECTVMPPSACHLAAVGEEANRLDEMMLHIAQMTETDMQNRLERLLNLLTPALTLFMGLLVAGLITAVMNAILSVNEMVLP
jgi:general secretion pathway protein F